MHLQTKRDNPTGEESQSNRTEETAVGNLKSAKDVGTTARDPKKSVPRSIIPVDGVTRWGTLQVSAEAPAGRVNALNSAIFLALEE